MRSALHDPEARLPLSRRRGQAPSRPRARSLHRALDRAELRSSRRALVERHRDVRPQEALDTHRGLGCEAELLTIEVRAERDTVVVDRIELREREDLEAAAV